MLKNTAIMIGFIGLLTILSTKDSFSAAQTFAEVEQQPVKAVTDNVKLSKVSEHSLRPTILSILDIASQAPEEAKEKLTLLNLDISTLNVAEQYLLLLAQAKIKQHELQHAQVVELLEQAKALNEKITKQQLDLPLFADLYHVLAQSLVALNNFEAAYQAKKTYIEKFNDYSDTKRDETIALLTKKYELAHKIEANKLLDNQNKLKILQLGDVQKKQVYQQRNFILIFASILIFILLFLRQFKVRKKLLILSKTDSLTALLNRSALFSIGNKLVKSTIEHDKDLSVLLFDIDYFKQVNDNYGHHVGDLVLVEIANLVNETMRARDVVARLGGEEFVILLPDTDIDKAKAIAVRVIEKVATYSFSHLGIDRPITLSIGVANIQDTASVFDEILHAADLAMYQAKQQGRNQMINYATIAEDQERRTN
ncbi:MAG: GGDEF domain-containing protein [Colwellia sp.]|nr:GGDEF domain-containing protein [Colwellia sp.]MCW9080033.1 GGDEF domain-containing protein [Colwellia sp.]